jgi:hypothetical protein
MGVLIMSDRFNKLNLHMGPINIGLGVNDEKPIIQLGIDAFVEKELYGIQLAAEGAVMKGGVLQAGLNTESLDTFGLKLSLWDRVQACFSGIKIAAYNDDYGDVKGLRLGILNTHLEATERNINSRFINRKVIEKCYNMNLSGKEIEKEN